MHREAFHGLVVGGSHPRRCMAILEKRTAVATAPRNRTYLCPDSVCGRGLPIYTCFVFGSSTESVRGGQVHLGKRQQVACAG